VRGANSGLDDTLRVWLDELEAIAKSSLILHHGANGDRTRRKRELQLNHFAYGNLQLQHGGDSRLTDIHGVPLQHACAARIYADIGL
jgi:hypothetical protein